MKLDIEILSDFYCKEVRSVLEFGVPVWNSGITKKMSDQIERIQKICLSIILCDGPTNIPYFEACTLLSLEPLIYRRHDLCITFIQRASLDPQHSDMFCRNSNNSNTRNKQPDYREYKCRTSRLYNSPLCYLTRVLNNNPVKQNQSN